MSELKQFVFFVHETGKQDDDERSSGISIDR